ncbi:MAG: threonylcarbamoyl-AMP synthase [Gammaproteobacteria bacterium RIFCSPLOWO2_02_FULL_42_14]|nr:MAG: threonylcarbamoyl-AMP synthase [Gammaproteobacteria bacterium RIFCSPHIGHO2_02_FULL_42_43]OGT29105.1 MAG: threonylcarbamoyl-AMP synthase [Gammaproteobacteria bacterium RIFCSPHIGHO2_01_FULL_42_8]OGT51334.1 MAG: threonylcarbamoyl-AMP synthase [Gammaproteobacteria bacterium RIFCSPHIGHO2_12_FULL_41_25]OGT62036.1 MAG: threonylcarbamoyl-AMP synthase [Gammaproteobacteria bacterium RIFCSPLOWO2_02_FULL_42_14]OGT85709.1 MAG: threonylcarbamoyl-AMP synthase [Gammaproteobacteria bacterium RIFCSPLOWO2
MEILKSHQIIDAVRYLKDGKVIAYPTEAVFGLGCDPSNVDAVSRILQIKHRAMDKGFILIAATWEQLEPLVIYPRPDLLSRVFDTWPGPTTWLFPASKEVPFWIRGNHHSVAVRVTAHPIAKALCEGFDGPIISTSCNKSGDPPARDVRTIQLTLSDTVDYVLEGELGGRMRPTEIRDVLTGEVIRG